MTSLLLIYLPARVACRLGHHNVTCVGRVDHPTLAGANLWTGKAGRWIGPRQHPPMTGKPTPHVRLP